MEDGFLSTQMQTARGPAPVRWCTCPREWMLDTVWSYSFHNTEYRSAREGMGCRHAPPEGRQTRDSECCQLQAMCRSRQVHRKRRQLEARPGRECYGW